jgi:hypothetical protein
MRGTEQVIRALLVAGEERRRVGAHKLGGNRLEVGRCTAH